ncbi:magnesium transporter [Temperatibacter marinus]|uniref:Magnesium transporter MgtE n=1 Tax=Temperatibacter marinus TaxID=1456591 RepID=A0AA52EG88_9PROT|nr:magnesium transporter [Temperatibacter marinus]WND02568.1 magnesium transporter [Temperatibacter marinus]
MTESNFTHEDSRADELSHAEVYIELHQDKDFIDELVAHIESDSPDNVFNFLEPYNAADVADLMEVLSYKERRDLIRLLGEKLDPEVLSEIEGSAQDDLYDQLSNEQIADAVTDMEIDDAVYVIEELDEEDRSEVLSALPHDDREAIKESLSYPEDSAGRMMQKDLVALPEFWSVGQAIDLLRDQSSDLPEDFYDVFVVSPIHHPVGKVSLAKIMRARRSTKIQSIMEQDPPTVNVMADQEEVAYRFTKYHLISAAVTDENNRLVGMITVDDVVDVIEEEAEEDILALAGVGEESMGDSVFSISKDRFKWLFVNLLTAILASLVIGLYEQTIEKLVALAVLMPIVASMGGNAATQTMTVTVRALATKEISPANASRSVWKEFKVAMINGIFLSLISGGVAVLWFGNPLLGSVFAAAMIFNLMCAGLCGILIPLSIDKLGQDPAIASSVFVTTITDVIGFFAFLGLATVVLPPL